MTRMFRDVEPADAAAIVEILGHEIAGGVAHFGSKPPPIAEVEAEIAVGLPWRVAAVDGRAVAFARATPWKPRDAYRWTVELGIYVARGHQRQGLGRTLVEQVLDQAVERGFRCFLAGITLPNPGSVALFEGLAFRSVGTFPAIGFKHGAWRDVGYWSRTVGEGSPC